MKNLNPNIKETVLWLREKGFETTDSGDGSNFQAGMEGALEFPHVFMTVEPKHLISRCLILKILLEEMNLSLDNISIEGNYSPVDNVAVIMLLDYSGKNKLNKAIKVELNT